MQYLRMVARPALMGIVVLLGVAFVVLFSVNSTTAKQQQQQQQHGSDWTPPVISDLRVESVTDSSAVVFWTTDEPADTELHYGIYPKQDQMGPRDTALVLSHAVALTGLQAETKYAYCAVSRDAARNRASLCDAFTTLAATSSPPEPPPPPATTTPVSSGEGSGVEQRVSVSGFAYPDALVTATLTRVPQNDASVMASASSSPDGAFSIAFNRFGPGTYRLSLEAKDRAGIVSAQKGVGTFTYTGGGFVFGRAGIVMAPTIVLGQDLVARNGTITVSGSAMPNTSVLVEVGTTTHETRSDQAGAYAISIPASTLTPGRYTVNARSSAISASGYDYSLTKIVTIEKSAFIQADLNKDGVVNAADLSIYLAHPVDLNGDGKVTVADFSVLLRAISDNL